MKKVLKFHATWCNPCKMLSDTIAGITQELPVELENIDIDENTEMANKFNIRSIPALVLLDENGVETHRKIGGMTKTAFMEFINQ
jgi:thioredoxin 1